MQIKYSLDKDDFLVYQLFVASQSKNVKSRRFKSLIYVPVIYFFIGILGHFLNMRSFVYIFPGLAFFWLIFYPFYSRWQYKNHYKKHIEEHYQGKINVESTLSFLKDYMKIESDAGEGKLKYSELVNLFEIPAYFYLKLKSGESIIIPKRKLDNDLLQKIIIQLKEKTGLETIQLLNWKWR